VPVREVAPEEHVMRATSVSAGGLYCPDALARPKGVTLMIEVEVGNVPVRASVVVVHTAKSGFGLGLAFDNPPPALEAFLGKLGSDFDETTAPWYR
jgi:hypothetical protein